jgi:hypothetical protein
MSSRATVVIHRGPSFRRCRALSLRSSDKDFSAVIDALEPIAGELERIGGSRAQLDLVEFTLLKAYVGADRLHDARRMLSGRHRGSASPPVAGLAVVY